MEEKRIKKRPQKFTNNVDDTRALCLLLVTYQHMTELRIDELTSKDIPSIKKYAMRKWLVARDTWFAPIEWKAVFGALDDYSAGPNAKERLSNVVGEDWAGWLQNLHVKENGELQQLEKELDQIKKVVVILSDFISDPAGSIDRS